MDRHFADKAGIVVRKYKSQGFVRVQVPTPGANPFAIYAWRPTKAAADSLTYGWHLFTHARTLDLPFLFGWWRKRPYLVFRDDQNRWWKLYEARPTIDGANAGVSEPGGNATLYTGSVASEDHLS
jgi:hypothetical protein